MNKKLKITLGVIALLIISGAIFFASTIFFMVKDGDRILSLEDVFNFQAEELVRNNRDYLIISGEYMDSSLRIKNVKEEENNGEIIVRVSTELIGEGDASFIHIVEIDDSINRVFFGEKEEVIWKRTK